VAVGGTTGQVLQKLSATNYDTGWLTLPADYITSVTAPLAVTTGNLTVDLSTYAPLASPAFTGNPTAPTPSIGDNDTSIATTAFVKAQGYLYAPTISWSYGAVEDGSTVTGLSVLTTATNFLFSASTTSYGATGGVPIENESGSFNLTKSGLSLYRYPLYNGQNPASPTVGGELNYDSETAVLTLRAFTAAPTDNTITIAPTGITFPDTTVQTIAFPGFTGYATLASPAFTGNPTAPTPATSDNDTSIATTAYVKAQDFGDRYLTTSTTSNTINNANKTFTIGTGLSYTPTQNITISYDASNHMHGEVLTYSTSTGVLTVDIKNHTGSGTYTAWVVNVGGVTPATSVAFADITGAVSGNVNLQAALDLKSNLASPTFSGSPSLPTGTTGITQTAGNNTTALATTAFVTAATPSASTTVSGLVELATNAEAQTGSSTTLGMSPSTVAYAKSSPSFFRMSALSSVGATSGTGSSASLLVGGYNTRAPTTAVGYGILSFGLYFHSRASGGQVATPLPWNKRFVAQFRFAPRTLGTDANTINRVLFGKASGSTAGELTLRGVGVRQIANGALELVVHNGTTFTAVTSSFTPTVAQSSTDLRIVSDGAGNVTLFNNDTQIATTSAGPSTAGATSNFFLTVESENLATITGTNNTLYTAEMSFEFAY
jgi:hypothetical protein